MPTVLVEVDALDHKKTDKGDQEVRKDHSRVNKE